MVREYILERVRRLGDALEAAGLKLQCVYSFPWEKRAKRTGKGLSSEDAAKILHHAWMAGNEPLWSSSALFGILGRGQKG